MKNLNTFNTAWMSYFDLEAVCSIEKSHDRMISGLNQYSEKFTEFVELVVDSVSIKLARLEQMYLEVEAAKKRVDAEFDRLKKNPPSIAIYSTFKALFYPDQQTLRELAKAREDLESQRLQKEQEGKIFYEASLMFDENAGVMQIGASAENLGLILQCNPGIERLSQVALEDLIGSNIRAIIPEPFKAIH